MQNELNHIWSKAVLLRFTTEWPEFPFPRFQCFLFTLKTSFTLQDKIRSIIYAEFNIWNNEDAFYRFSSWLSICHKTIFLICICWSWAVVWNCNCISRIFCTLWLRLSLFFSHNHWHWTIHWSQCNEQPIFCWIIKLKHVIQLLLTM